MASNRRRHNNSLPVGALTRTILLVFLVGVTGFGYVYLQIQLHATGRQIQALESEVKDLDRENEVSLAAISSLESRSALQRRLDTGFIKMEPVTNQSIVRLNAPAPSLVAVGSIRPVSNQEIEK